MLAKQLATAGQCVANIPNWPDFTEFWQNLRCRGNISATVGALVGNFGVRRDRWGKLFGMCQLLGNSLRGKRPALPISTKATQIVDIRRRVIWPPGHPPTSNRHCAGNSSALNRHLSSFECTWFPPERDSSRQSVDMCRRARWFRPRRGLIESSPGSVTAGNAEHRPILNLPRNRRSIPKATSAASRNSAREHV